MNEKEDIVPLTPAKVTKYRALCARINYLALDRPDLQYAAKEASRKMGAPQSGDWLILRRIGRYLQGTPRVTQLFA